MRGTPASVEGAARNLRRQVTPAEVTLWVALRRRQLHGLKFRRQQPLRCLVLNLVYPAARHVVGVDGPLSESGEQAGDDALRMSQLEAFGYRVLRVLHGDIEHNLPAVLERIASEAHHRGSGVVE